MWTLLSVTKNLLGTPPMPTMLAYSQSMATMTTDLINFTVIPRNQVIHWLLKSEAVLPLIFHQFLATFWGLATQDSSATIR
jgi:hypothetical protein